MKFECGFETGDGGNRMMKHDAHWCPKCDKWLDLVCKEDPCEFCIDRPEKPSLVEDQRKWELE